MSDWLKLIPAAEARRILSEVEPIGMEHVPLRQAAGRVLAVSLTAPHDLPLTRLSAMDGYAVRARDVQAAMSISAAGPAEASLRVVGAIAAGTTFAGTVNPGEAVGIATGGVLPDGADAVLMVELASLVGDPGASASAGAMVDGYVQPGSRLRPTRLLVAGDNVVRPGEDITAGARLLPAGRRLRAVDLAALASFGVVDVPVYRRPLIAVLATGSEICPPDQAPRPGQVRDSNQYVLAAAVGSAGGIAVAGGIVGDDAGLLQAAVARLLAASDGVILSGGSSVGPKDLTARVLDALGPPGVLFHGIDIRPGKPTVFGRVGPKPLIGMPGFPSSSTVVFEAFVRPLLARLGGETVPGPWPAAISARLTRAYQKPASREDYLRVRLDERDGELWADALPGGSFAISTLIVADGLARIPAGQDRLEPGAPVAVRRFI